MAERVVAPAAWLQTAPVLLPAHARRGPEVGNGGRCVLPRRTSGEIGDVPRDPAIGRRRGATPGRQARFSLAGRLPRRTTALATVGVRRGVAMPSSHQRRHRPAAARPERRHRQDRRRVVPGRRDVQGVLSQSVRVSHRIAVASLDRDARSACPAASRIGDAGQVRQISARTGTAVGSCDWPAARINRETSSCSSRDSDRIASICGS
jgi:hypothetical protein